MLRALLAIPLAAWLSMPQSMPEARPLTVSAAVSLSDALTAIAQEYGRLGRGSIRFNFGASNTLARQIVNGARIDLFISADAAQMTVVAAAGLLKEGTRVDLLRNQLAVVVASDRPRTFKGIAELAGPEFKRIALGDPAAVPAGVYARQHLEKEGLWRAVEARIVPTASVRAALTAVTSGAADAAIVYRTDARMAVGATIAWLVPAERGPRIVYPAAIMREAMPETQRFLDFLRGEAASRIFERYGFQK